MSFKSADIGAEYRFRSGTEHRAYVGERRVNAQGYIEVLVPSHPKKHAGRVREHVLKAEKALGKPLPKGVEVHHVNGDKTDNRNENLVICQDRAYHKLLEVRTRALQATGDPTSRRCSVCKQWDEIGNLRSYPPYRGHHHRDCWAKKLRDQRQQRKR